ncbi:MAG: putative flap endonuclease-1-like 5' DNA nuclease [Neolewinella sp.]|jgi:predicted flap endonuclease-1-like 5' DNA nuclease
MNNIFLHIDHGLFGLGHCAWWIAWTIAAFALGAILHWLLWGRAEKVDVSGIEADRDRYHASATKWEKDYQSIKYQLEESQKAEADLRASLQRCEADRHIMRVAAESAAAIVVPVPVDTGALGIASGMGGGGSIYAGLFTDDNFQIIEGVGPKVNDVLINAGYKNWSELAKADSNDLRAKLDAAGKNFALCDPTSWPHQASLAAAGNWDDLITYQKFTDGGRETVGDFETDSKFEKLAAKKLGFSSSNPNDLKVVEGIGPKIEGLLKADGINNWFELAAADADRIQNVLNDAGSRYKLAKPGTWPQQAGLAAAGNWAELKALQDDLKGGV